VNLDIIIDKAAFPFPNMTLKNPGNVNQDIDTANFLISCFPQQNLIFPSYYFVQWVQPRP